MDSDSSKVCVVGLDGATWDLLDPWLDELPTIRAFSDTVRMELDSCIPPISVPAWKCYSTGLDPGTLGVFTFVEPDFEEQRFKTVSSETFTHREIWDYLGMDDYRSAVINMPSTSPPREIPGWMISGPFSTPREFATPHRFQEDLANDGYTILPQYYLSRDPADLSDALEMVEKRLGIAHKLREDADFIHVTLYITDTIQHVEFDSAVTKQFWKGLDQVLGEFVASLGDDWNVVLMSDHGFGRTSGRFYLHTWLEQAGYLQFTDSGRDIGDLASMFGIDYQTAFRIVRVLRIEPILRSVFPTDFLLRVARQLPGNRRLQGLENKIDWDSDAIALPPLIYTKNREIAREIRSELLDLETPEGTRVVEDVFYGSDLYPASPTRVPDLIVKHGDWDINPLYNPDEVFEATPTEGIIAHHRRNGILAAQGPDVEQPTEETARLIDLAPTLLDAYGVDIPAQMTGSSIGLLGSHSTVSPVSIDRGSDRNIDHNAEVRRKLENLGYL